MQKSALQLLIEKASQGDEGSLQKLSTKLCDRLVFVPIAESTQMNESQVKISNIIVREGERKILPVFLTTQSLNRWMSLVELAGEGMSLYCSDILKALGPNYWIMLEAGSPSWVEIDPSYTETIRLYEPMEEEPFFEPAPSKPMATAKPMNLTQEVPIVPHPMTTQANANPAEKVTQFPFQKKNQDDEPSRSSGLKRFRHNDEDDIRATMDLTALRNRK